MERYEFTATTAKSDIIIGILFPMFLMLPVLGIQLAIFYLKLNDFFKSQPLFLYTIVLVFFGISFLLIKKIQGSLVKNFVVELSGRNIRIWCDGKEIVSGEVIFCRIKNKEPKLGARALNVDIDTKGDNIKFRVRSKEYENLSSSTWNPLGTSKPSDVETLLSLGKKIKNAMEEEVLIEDEASKPGGCESRSFTSRWERVYR